MTPITSPPHWLLDTVVARYHNHHCFRYMYNLYTARQLDDGPLLAQMLGWIEADAEHLTPACARELRALIRVAEGEAADAREGDADGGPQ